MAHPLVDQLPDLLDELASEERRAARSAARIAALRSIIQGIRDYPADDDPLSAQIALADVGVDMHDSLGTATLTVSSPASPRGADALRTLYAASGDVFNAGDATKEIRR